MSTTDSSKASLASTKYNLDENNTKDILVYKYRGGLAIESQASLCKTLDKDPRLRVSRKPIPRGDSRVEVRQEDLYNEPQRSEYQKYPSMKNSLASVGLPRSVYWRRLLFDQFEDLYIVSPESSPESSPEASRHVSPRGTFGGGAEASGKGHEVNKSGQV